MATVRAISERCLVPVLEELIEACPLKVRGFDADNGSEYINHRVVEMLKGLHVPEFIKSRPRRSNDNALVESRNGNVIRRHFGYRHIPKLFAPVPAGSIRPHRTLKAQLPNDRSPSSRLDGTRVLERNPVNSPASRQRVPRDGDEVVNGLELQRKGGRSLRAPRRYSRHSKAEVSLAGAATSPWRLR